MNSTPAEFAAPNGAASDASRIRRLTCFDAVTGLPNRLLFREQLGLVLRMAARNGHPVAVMLADLDDFRRVRHSLGHARSNVFVKAIAERIGACLRDSDVMTGGLGSARTGAVARIDGHEFAIVLSDLGQLHDAQRVAQRLRQAIGAPVTIDSREIFPSMSIGIALYPTDGADAETLIEHADIALGQAQGQGKDRVQFYSHATHTLAADRIELESSLRRGVDAGEFFPMFQPRIDGRSGTVCGTEALVRWRHPTRGIVAPASFIEVAEQSRLIAPIGEHMLEAGCLQNARWQQLGLPELPVSVNVSALQISRPDFVDTVARALERSGMRAQTLELEVTESMLMNDAAGALRTFTAIKALGVRIAIDDFGTGFSSLSYLRDFPFDVLKIDRSFVMRLPHDAKTAGVTCGIIDLTRRLGLEVVAEGVETQEQATFLIANGCHLMQGHLYAEPLEAAALEQLLSRRLPSPAPLVVGG